MKSNHLRLVLMAAASWALAFNGVSPLAAQHSHAAANPGEAGYQATSQKAAPGEHVMKVGKRGEMTFYTETRVGDVLLQPGAYTFQHRTDGSDHFVHFIQVTKPHPSGGGGGVPKAHPGEVKCRLEPLQKKVSGTSVYSEKEDGAMRITKILVAGENMAHLF